MERWEDLTQAERLELIESAVMWAGRLYLKSLGSSNETSLTAFTGIIEVCNVSKQTANKTGSKSLGDGAKTTSKGTAENTMETQSAEPQDESTATDELTTTDMSTLGLTVEAVSLSIGISWSKNSDANLSKANQSTTKTELETTTDPRTSNSGLEQLDTDREQPSLSAPIAQSPTIQNLEVQGTRRVDSLSVPQAPRYSSGFEPTFEHDPFIDGLTKKDYPEDAP